MKLSRVLSNVILTMILSTGLLLLAAGTTQADLIEADLEPGDRLITYDTENDLEWLDLTATQGLSVIDVLGTNWVKPEAEGGYGFRYATPAEVVELFVAAGIPNIGSTSRENYLGVDELLGLMGVTFAKKRAIGSKGLHDIGDPGFESGFAGIAYLRLGEQRNPSAKAQVSKDLVKTEARFVEAGSYLVR